MLVAVVFTMTSLSWGPSGAQAFAAVAASPSGLSNASDLQKILYAIPSEMGSVVSVWNSPANESRKGFVVQIQDAHSNPEGQANVAAMMKYLEGQSRELVIGLEGSAAELHPEYLNFFKEFPEANRAVVEDLRLKGELNGAELFLLDKHLSSTRNMRVGGLNVEFGSLSGLKKTPVKGVETLELYQDDLRTFRDLLSHREEIRTLLGPGRMKLESDSSKILNGELRSFLKERSRRKEGRFAALSASSDPDLQAYIRYLQKQSLKILGIDLRDPIEQLRSPNMLRVALMDEARRGIDPEKIKTQWADALRELNASAKDAVEKDFVEAFASFGREKGFLPAVEGNAMVPQVDGNLYPRKLLESLFRFAQNHKLSFAGREAFWQSWKIAVFQAEIDVAELSGEMDSLEEGLLGKLVRSDEEKVLVQKLGNYDLLEKMLRLELSRAEYDRACAKRDEIKRLAGEAKPLVVFLDKAYHFYEVSLKRDEALVTNLMALVPEAAGAKVPVRVLYSGGFHTPGVAEILRKKGIGYAVLAPRITKTDHGEMYEKAMRGDNADLSAYFKIKNPFLTKQEALFFKQVIETAAPVLSQKYQLRSGDVATRVAKVFKEHPVFSGTIDVGQSVPEGQSLLRVSTRPGRNELAPSHASVMPEPVTADVPETRILALGHSEIRTADLNFTAGAAAATETAMRAEVKEQGLQDAGEVTAPKVSVDLGNFSFLKNGMVGVGAAVPKARSEIRTAGIGGYSLGQASFVSKVIFRTPQEFQFSYVIDKSGAENALLEFQIWCKQLLGGEAPDFTKALSAIFPEDQPLAVAYLSQKMSKWSADWLEKAKRSRSASIEHPIAQFIFDINQDMKQLQKQQKTRGLSTKKSEDLRSRIRMLELLLTAAQLEARVWRAKGYGLAEAEYVEKAVTAVIASIDSHVESLNQEIALLGQYKTEDPKKAEEVAKSIEALKDARKTLETHKMFAGMWDFKNFQDVLKTFYGYRHGRNGMIAKTAEKRAALKEKCEKYKFKYSDIAVGARIDELQARIERLQQELQGQLPLESQGRALTETEIAEAQVQLKELTTAVNDIKMHGKNSSSMDDLARAVKGIVERAAAAMEQEKVEHLSEPVAEAKSASASGELEESLALLVREDVTIEDIDRELLIHPSIRYILTTRGVPNSHWVLLLCGRPNAPEIVFLDEAGHKDAIDKIKYGDKIATLTGADGKSSIYVNPDKDKKLLLEAEARARETRRLQALEAMVAPIAARDLVGLNLEASGPAPTAGDFSGMVRSDVLPPAMGKPLVAIATRHESDSGVIGPWETNLRKIAESAAAGTVAVDALTALGLEDTHGGAGLFHAFVDAYKPLLTSAFFKASPSASDPTKLERKKHPIRGLDLVNDSKNRDVFLDLQKVYGKERPISSFDFYRTPAGKIAIIEQIAARYFIHALEYPGASFDVSPQLNVFFPMVKGPEDIDYIFKEILPLAKAYAVSKMIDAQGIQDPKEWGRAWARIDRVEKDTQFGIMVEWPEILRDPSLRRAIIQDPRLSFFNVGTNDLELFFWQEHYKGAKLSREGSAGKFIFGQAHTGLFRGLDDFAADLRTLAPEKRMCICGALAANPKLIAIAALWKQLGTRISLSVNLKDLPSTRTRAQLFGRGAMKEVLESLQKVIQDPSVTHEELDKKMVQVVNDPEMAKVQVTLLDAEAWTERYLRRGGFASMHHLDLDVDNGIGGIKEFDHLLSLARHEGWLPVAVAIESDKISETQLRIPLEKMIQRNILFPAESRDLLQAWRFLSAVRKHLQEKRKKDNRYQGNLHPELIRDFIQDLPWGIPDEQRTVAMFYRQYQLYTNLVFETMTRVMHESVAAVFPPARSDIPESDLNLPAGVHLADFGAVTIRERLGISFLTEEGLAYHKHRAIYYEGNGASWKEHPEDLIKIFELSALTGDRISHETQKMIRAYISEMKAPTALDKPPAAASAAFRRILVSPHPDGYALTRMHRFRILDRLFPGAYQSFEDYFLGDGQPFTAYLMAMRALELVEKLPDSKESVLSRASKVADGILRGPFDDRRLVFRLAMLWRHLVIKESSISQRITALATAENGDALEKYQSLWDDIRGKIDYYDRASGILPSGENRDELLRQITWLIYHQILLSQHDFLNQEEIAEALKKIFFSNGFKDLKGEQSTSYLFDMLYLMAFAIRLSQVEPEKEELLKRSGSMSPLANLDTFYLAGHAILEPQSAKDPSHPYKAETHLLAAIEDANWAVNHGADRMAGQGASRDDQVALGKSFDSAFEEVPAAAHSYFMNRNLPKEESEALAAILSNRAEMATVYQRYGALVTPYYMNQLTSRGLAEQIVFFAHLTLMVKTAKVASSGVAFLASPIIHPFNSAYEMYFGITRDQRGVIDAILRIVAAKGFRMESVQVYPVPGADGQIAKSGNPLIVRVLGSFPNDVSAPSEKIVSIYNDSNHVFAKGRNRIESIHQAVLKLYKPMVLGAVDSSWRKQTTEVRFTDDDELLIKTNDRFGLSAAIFELLSWGYQLDIAGFNFDDVRSRFPRMLIKFKRKVDAEKRAAIRESLVEILSNTGEVTINGKTWKKRSELRSSEKAGGVARSEARAEHAIKVTFQNRQGLHARSAMVLMKLSLFVKEKGIDVEITDVNKSASAAGDEIMALIVLAVADKTPLKVTLTSEKHGADVLAKVGEVYADFLVDSPTLEMDKPLEPYLNRVEQAVRSEMRAGRVELSREEGLAAVQQREKVFKQASAKRALAAEDLARPFAVIDQMTLIKNLPQRVPSSLGKVAAQAVRSVLTGDAKQRIQEMVRQTPVELVVARDEDLKNYFDEKTGLRKLAWVGADGKFYILSRFYEYLANLKAEDDDARSARLVAALLVRLAVVKLIQNSLSQNNVPQTQPVNVAIEKMASLLERDIAGGTDVEGDALQAERASALGDAALIFNYTNRFDRQALPKTMNVSRKSSTSPEERVMDSFEDKLRDIALTYYQNRQYAKARTRETPAIAGIRQKITDKFAGLRTQFERENLNDLGPGAIRAIRSIQDPAVLEAKINRYTAEYEDILRRINKYIGDDAQRERLARLNESAREVLSRLILMEMHPLWIESMLRQGDIEPGTPRYQKVFEKLRVLRYHMSAFRRELAWFRVRQAGRQKIAKYFYDENSRGENTSEIGEYLLSPQFFRGEGNARYPAFLATAAGELKEGNWNKFRDQIRQLLKKGKIDESRTGYVRRQIYYKETVERLIKPYWEKQTTPLEDLAAFRSFVVERLASEGVPVTKPAERFTVAEIMDMFTRGPVYEEQMAGVILQDIQEYLDEHLARPEDQAEVNKRFTNVVPDSDQLAAEQVTPTYGSIFDLLRSYNHTLESYAEANLIAYDLIGYVDDSLDRLTALQKKEFQQLPQELSRAKELAEGAIRQNLAYILEWSLRGQKPSRTLLAGDAAAAQVAFSFGDAKTVMKALEWVRFRLNGYIERNFNISKYVALKAMGMRDFIRLPAQKFLGGAQVAEIVTLTDQLRERYLPARFTEPGYQRARTRLYRSARSLEKLDGRKLRSANPADNEDRKKFIKLLVELELLIYDVAHKYTSDEDFQPLEDEQRGYLGRSLVGRPVDEVTFDQPTFFAALNVAKKDPSSARSEMRGGRTARSEEKSAWERTFDVVEYSLIAALVAVFAFGFWKMYKGQSSKPPVQPKTELRISEPTPTPKPIATPKPRAPAEYEGGRYGVENLAMRSEARTQPSQWPPQSVLVVAKSGPRGVLEKILSPKFKWVSSYSETSDLLIVDTDIEPQWLDALAYAAQQNVLSPVIFLEKDPARFRPFWGMESEVPYIVVKKTDFGMIDPKMLDAVIAELGKKVMARPAASYTDEERLMNLANHVLIEQEPVLASSETMTRAKLIDAVDALITLYRKLDVNNRDIGHALMVLPSALDRFDYPERQPGKMFPPGTRFLLQYSAGHSLREWRELQGRYQDMKAEEIRKKLKPMIVNLEWLAGFLEEARSLTTEERIQLKPKINGVLKVIRMFSARSEIRAKHEIEVMFKNHEGLNAKPAVVIATFSVFLKEKGIDVVIVDEAEGEEAVADDVMEIIMLAVIDNTPLKVMLASSRYSADVLVNIGKIYADLLSDPNTLEVNAPLGPYITRVEQAVRSEARTEYETRGLFQDFNGLHAKPVIVISKLSQWVKQGGIDVTITNEENGKVAAADNVEQLLVLAARHGIYLRVKLKSDKLGREALEKVGKIYTDLLGDQDTLEAKRPLDAYKDRVEQALRSEMRAGEDKKLRGEETLHFKHVLIVEDDPDLNELLPVLVAAALRGKPQSLYVTRNGKEALDILRRNPQIDLVVTDVSLPGMDGVSWVLEAAKSRSDLSVVFMTGGHSDLVETNRRNLNKKGLNYSVLHKPFQIHGLHGLRRALETVEKNTKRSEMRQAESSIPSPEEHVLEMNQAIATGSSRAVAGVISGRLLRLFDDLRQRGIFVRNGDVPELHLDAGALQFMNNGFSELEDMVRTMEKTATKGTEIYDFMQTVLNRAQNSRLSFYDLRNNNPLSMVWMMAAFLSENDREAVDEEIPRLIGVLQDIEKLAGILKDFSNGQGPVSTYQTEGWISKKPETFIRLNDWKKNPPSSDAEKAAYEVETQSPPAIVSVGGAVARAEARSLVLAAQEVLIHDYVKGQRHIGVNALDVRLKDLSSQRPRWIQSQSAYKDYNGLRSVLKRMLEDATSMGYVREGDIKDAAVLAGRLVSNYRISGGFLASLKRVDQDLKRWSEAKEDQLRAMEVLGENKYAPKPDGMDALAYLKETGALWLVELAEVAGRYKEAKSGFYNEVVNPLMWPATYRWLQEPLSPEKLAAVKKDSLAILEKWHKFERLLDGTLRDKHPHPGVQGQDGLGPRLRKELFLQWEGLNFMMQAVEPLMPRSSVVVAEPARIENAPAAPNAGRYVQGELFPRSELRLVESTKDFKLSEFRLEQIELPYVEPEKLKTIEEAARVLGNVYLSEAVSDVTGWTPEQSRTWIAVQLLKGEVSGRKGKIDSVKLREIMDEINRSAFLAAKNLTVSPDERGLHVALPALNGEQLEALAGYAPFLLALAVSLNTKLYLNAQVDPLRANLIERSFLESAKRSGVSMGDGQFRVFSSFDSQRGAFRSLQEKGIKTDALLAAEEEQLRDQGIESTYWYNSANAHNDVRILASEIAEALYAALDQKILKRKATDISVYSAQLTTAILNAIQAAQAIKQAA